MAKKRENTHKGSSIIAIAIEANWWFSAIVSAGIFVFVFFIFPTLELQSVFIRAFAGAFKLILILSGGFFAMLAVVKFVIQTEPAKNLSTQKISPIIQSISDVRKGNAFFESKSKTSNVCAKTSTQWGYSGFQSNPIGADKAKRPTSWSIELLRDLEWKRFEMLCAEYFRVLGKRVETINHGADGGIDARIYANNSNNLEFAIQCKAWGSMVGIKPIRELFGVMAHESAGKGIFMATSRFSEDVKKFAAEHSDKLFIIDGEKFLSMLSNLPEGKQQKLLAYATEGDYKTPTCASCGIKMVWRNKGDFWGCSNYPKCKSTLKVAKA